MPVPITSASVPSLARLFDEALALVRNEFEQLDRNRQYRNAFARLMKPDPLERVPVLGTDARDLFVPVLHGVIGRAVPPGGHVLDLGGGDGRTFALLAPRLPETSVVSVIEPDPVFLRDYMDRLAAQPHLLPGAVLETTFEGIDHQPALPADGSIDLVLALHMLYFVPDPAAGLVRMARFLSPGGALCLVASAGTGGYTEQILAAFLAEGGDIGGSRGHPSAPVERERLLAGGIRNVLGDALPGIAFELDSSVQPSRMYGHTLADLIALAGVAELAEVPGTAKFAAAARLMRRNPEAVDLRIEDEGPRKGMWSVAHPQRVTIVRRRAH